MPRPKNKFWAYTAHNAKESALVVCLAQSVCVHLEVRNGYGRARGVGAAPRRRRTHEAI